MVCVAGIGRIILVVVNTVSSMVALGIIASGFIIKYVLGNILESDVIDTVTKVAFSFFVQNTPVPETIDFGPLTDTVGVVLIVIGFCLLAVSIFGCCAVCCSFRALLLAFCALIGLLIVGQIVFYAVVLPRNSQIHKDAKDTLETDLQTEYNRKNVNSFTISADVIFLAAECCGVKGPSDFVENKNLEFNFSTGLISPIVPPSCCKYDYIIKLDWTCAMDTTATEYWTEGCYDKMQDIVESWYPWLIPAIIITFLVQIGEIIAAIMIYKDDNSNSIV